MQTQRYTNQSNIPLSVAVFLANDTYDYAEGISATSLLKPVRQLVLAPRVPPEKRQTDIAEVFKSRMGTALHDAIESAWHGDRVKTLISLGYPKNVAERVLVNPEPHEIKDDSIVVWQEIRSSREIDGKLVTGKFDFVAEGNLEDFKSTSVYTYMKGRKDKDYQLQGSIYRWLNPDKITGDFISIQFLFTDYSAARRAEPGYPPAPSLEYKIPLLSLDDTENFIRKKLSLVETYKNSPEDQIPLCNDDELWRKEPVFKYYKNPEKVGGRSTKNFPNRKEAYERLLKDGSVGTVVEVLGEVGACKYCPAFEACGQKDTLIADGSLKI